MEEAANPNLAPAADALSAAAPKLRNEIDQTIQRLLEIGRTHEPLTILCQVAVTLLFHDPEQHGPGTDTGQSQVEHLVSLFLAQPFPVAPQSPTPGVIQECFDLLESIQHKFPIFYHASAKDADDLRASLMVDAQFIRGHAYAFHVSQQFLELASAHDAFLVQNLGFSARDFLFLLKHAELQINSNVNGRYSRVQQLLDEILNRYATARGSLPPGQRFEQGVAAVNDREFFQQNKAVAEEFMAEVDGWTSPEVLQVVPRNQKEATILSLLAATFGDNEPFLKVPNWCGWPLNPSVVQTKPFIQRDGRFYLPLAPLAMHGVLTLLEGIIERTDAAYYRDRFLPARDNYLEETAGNLIAQTLEGSVLYRNLFYRYQESGEARRAEVDRVVVYGEALLVVEAKAGKFSAQARRGAPKSLQSDLKEILDKAFTQGTRLLTLLRENSELPLFDERDRELLRLRAADFRHQFIIAVSFDSLGLLQCNLNAVRRLGLIQGKEWPWAVSLNDLRVITDQTAHPATLIHYLTRRIAANDVDVLNVKDELDFFGMYHDGQLFFPSGEKLDCTHMMVTGFTAQFDSYYDGLIGWRPRIAKPQPKMLPRNEALLTAMEKQRPKHFLSGCLDLLDVDGKTAESINGALDKIQASYSSRRKPQAMILTFDREKHFLVIGCAPKGICPPLQGFSHFVQAMKEKNPARVTAIFFDPPLGNGQVSVSTWAK